MELKHIYVNIIVYIYHYISTYIIEIQIYAYIINIYSLYIYILLYIIPALYKYIYIFFSIHICTYYSYLSQDADLSSLSQMDTFLGVCFGPLTIFDVAFSAQHVCHSG